MLGYLVFGISKTKNKSNDFGYASFLTIICIRFGLSTLGSLHQSSLGVGGFFLEFCGFLPFVGVR
jgi:hypothetical protein